MTRQQSAAISRREFIGASVASLLAAREAWAVDRPLAIPQVDSVTLHVIVDNATFGPFLATQSLPGLVVERFNGDINQPQMTRSPLQAEFGLSVLCESHLVQTTRRVLVDFGYSPGVLSHNIKALGIDTTQIDATVLSHGHLDHYGGFSGLFASKPSRPVALFVGGEETFCERLAMIGDPPPLMGALDRKQLSETGYDVRIAPDPRVIADHAFTTGTIPLEGFERAAIPTQMRPGVGCERDKLSPAKRDAKQLPDDAEHELATAYSVKGLGLIVIASCSHRGVLNTVRRAQKVSGIEKVHAIVGGFHLVRPRTEDEARRTAAEMAAMNPTYIVPMHCSGDVFMNEAIRIMPAKVIRPYVGTRLKFSAA